MKFKYCFLVVFLVVFFSFTDVYAQRGCCSHHGGVSGACSGGMQVCNDGTTSPSCACSGGSDNSSSSYGYRNSQSVVNYVYGCTDRNAYNYNSNANKDDGSCIAKIFGCMNNEATNYNSSANTNDGSCLFTREVVSYKKVKYKTKYKLKKHNKEGKILRKGKNGKIKIVTSITTNEKGEIVESTIKNKEVIKKAINKIISSKKNSKVKKVSK